MQEVKPFASMPQLQSPIESLNYFKILPRSSNVMAADACLDAGRDTYQSSNENPSNTKQPPIKTRLEFCPALCTSVNTARSLIVSIDNAPSTEPCGRDADYEHVMPRRHM